MCQNRFEKKMKLSEEHAKKCYNSHSNICDFIG